MSRVKYLVIEAENMEKAKEKFVSACKALSIPERSYLYIMGEINEGSINGETIKNNQSVTEMKTGFFLFEFDMKIVQYYDEIIASTAENTDGFHWCDTDSVTEFFPKIMGEI